MSSTNEIEVIRRTLSRPDLAGGSLTHESIDEIVVRLAEAFAAGDRSWATAAAVVCDAKDEHGPKDRHGSVLRTASNREIALVVAEFEAAGIKFTVTTGTDAMVRRDAFPLPARLRDRLQLV